MLHTRRIFMIGTIKYTDLVRIAKDYNNTFENHVRWNSFRQKKFILFIALFSTLPFLLYYGFHLWQDQKKFQAIATLILLYTVEFIALILKIWHDSIQTESKLKKLRLVESCDPKVILHDREHRRSWLKRELNISPHLYPALAEKLNQLEQCIQRQDKILASLDSRFMAWLTRMPKWVIGFGLPIAAALITISGQKIIESPTTLFSLASTNQNYIWITFLLLILALEAILLLSFIGAILSTSISYLLDVGTKKFCSQKSRNILKRDLYLLCELDIASLERANQ